METIILGILTLTFISYIWHIVKNYGILPSISESYYRLPVGKKLLFTLFCFGIGFSAAILGIVLANSVLMFLAGVGIAFVGAAAAFKQGIARWVHQWGAIIGISLGTLSIFFDFHMYIIGILFILLSSGVVILHKQIHNTNIFWVEILAFLSIILTFALSIF